MYRVGIITSSDKGAAGEREDLSGPAICEKLPADQYQVVRRILVPDEKEQLKEALIRLCDEDGCQLVLTTGGTGFSRRDVTPEATMEVADRMAPGIAEAIRAASMAITRRAMLSRAVSAIRGETLIINLPGSPKAVRESLDVILDTLPHGLDILSGEAGECGRNEKTAPRVLIKGAGDLASGIALRLHHCGCAILMTEREVPTTVRRTVAFSPAVYLGQAQVEDAVGVRCRSLSEAEDAMKRGQLAVMVDETAGICGQWKPDVVVDAILAKENLGTRISDAALVIGVGPGFTAGVDCHCVVETKRGHDLGRCIWDGSAIPNTGVPGNIGGYTSERLIRATADGIFRGVVSIGDLVTAGDLVAFAGEEPVYAQIDGVVRGLLQDGVAVSAGMKAGDVDPRCQVSHCFTVSDKARAIGGGVLEAIFTAKTIKGGNEA